MNRFWKSGRVRFAAAGAVALAVAALASVGGVGYAARLVGGSNISAAAAQYPPSKVTICHHTHSQKNLFVTINVSERALPAHLGHGDTVGPCPQQSLTPEQGEKPAKQHEEGSAPLQRASEGQGSRLVGHVGSTHGGPLQSNGGQGLGQSEPRAKARPTGTARRNGHSHDKAKGQGSGQGHGHSNGHGHGHGPKPTREPRPWQSRRRKLATPTDTRSRSRHQGRSSRRESPSRGSLAKQGISDDPARPLPAGILASTTRAQAALTKDLTGGVEAGRAHHPAAGVGRGAAQVEAAGGVW